MRTERWLSLAAAVASVAAGAGCGSSSSSSSAAAPPPATSQGAIAMVIESITLPDPASAGTTGGQQRPVVRFHVTDNTTGQPIDMVKEVAASLANPKGIPNSVPRFTVAQRDDRNDYRSYYASTANPKPYTVPEGLVAPPTSPQLQASAVGPTTTALAADLKPVGNGSFEFTMPATNQTGFDRNKTHTVAGWTVRSNGTADSDVSQASLDFVPSGVGTVTQYQTITDDRCNQCHGFVQAHGTRRGVALCITCHNPSSGDPETSRTVDFKVMIHKIHSGSTLPSVQQGKGYFIVGFNQTVADFSDITFPYHNHGVAHCTVCHSGAQADNWKKIPTQNVCTACHDNVQFSGTFDPCGVGTSFAANPNDCLHRGGPITVTDSRDPNACLGCHGPGTAAAIDKFHHGD